MGVQVIGSGGQQVTAVGVPTKRVNAAAVRIVGGSVPDHNDTTNRDAVDAHPISAITGLQDALDALTGGGGSNLRVDLAIADEGSDIDLDAAGPDNIPAVLIWGRASGNGVYEASVVDGWTLLDPQPTLVVADALVLWPDLGDPVLDTGVASIYDYSDTAGWQPVGLVPTLDGGSSQVWGPTGWVTAGGGALADLTDVDVTSDPPAQDDVLAWDDAENKWTPATLDGGVALSDATPQDLGTAAAGVSDEASRADHVHDMPTATDVGADPSGTAATAVTVHTADTTAVHGIADTSALVVTSDARLSDARTPTAHTHPAADIASGTVATARLGSGTADATTFLRGDQTWATPPSGVVVGNCRVFSPRPSGYGWAMWSGNQSFLASNTVQSASLPFTVSEAATLTILRIDVSTGSAGATHLMSLCECSPNGVPGDLIETFPAFDCSTIGEKSLSGLSTPLDRGSYYVFASLGGSTSGHTLRGVSTGGGGLSLTVGGTLVLETTTIGVQTGGSAGRGAGWRNTMPTPGVPISLPWGHALTSISIPNIGLVLT